MKTVTIELHNKQKLLLVSVPKGSHGFSLGFDNKNWLYYYPENNRDVNDHRHIEFDKELELLGTYNTATNEIDFEVDEKDGWVSRYSWMYRDYTLEVGGLATYSLTYYESFLSLLKSEVSKAFPLKENPKGDKPQPLGLYSPHKLVTAARDIRIQKWQESEGEVCPARFVCLLIQ